MTTDDLKRIAEACGYRVYQYGGCYSVVGSHGLIGDIGNPEVAQFCPHLDPAQAIECLDWRFEEYIIESWAEVDGRRMFRVIGSEYRGDWEGVSDKGFPAAACAAIMESLKPTP